MDSYQTTNGGYAASAQPKIRTSLSCAILTHLILFTTVFLIFIFCFNWPNPAVAWGSLVPYKFNWHPVLMVSAFVLFMGEALVSYRLLPIDHQTQKTVHFALQTCALATATVAIAFIIDFKIQGKAAHFLTIHSIVGLSTYILFCIQWLFGLYAFGVQALGETARASALPYHKYIGIVLFFMAWIAMLTGLLDREKAQFGNESTPAFRMANACGMFIIASGAAIIYHFGPLPAAKEHQDGPAERLL